jgi:hypothetical protein
MTRECKAFVRTKKAKTIVLDLLSLQFVEVLATAVHTGETLKHFTLKRGDVAVTDRGYAQYQGMHAAVTQGADLIVRLNPCSVVLHDALGAPVARCVTLKCQPTEPLRTLAATLCTTGGQHEVRGWRRAYRLNAEQAGRARHKCRQGHNKGTLMGPHLRPGRWDDSRGSEAV